MVKLRGRRSCVVMGKNRGRAWALGTRENDSAQCICRMGNTKYGLLALYFWAEQSPFTYIFNGADSYLSTIIVETIL